MSIDTGGRPASWGARVLRHWFVRFVIFFVTLLFLYILGQAVPSRLVKGYPPETRHLVALVSAVIAIPVMLWVYRALVHWLERRDVSELVPSRAIPQLTIGAFIGFVLLTIVITSLVLAGFGTIVVPPVVIVPVLAIGISLISGVAEELLFRGAMFRIVEERWGTLVGLLISAGFFGAVHAGNQGATLLSSVAIAVEAGLLLGLAYSATRTLWLPIGLHFGWNFTEGGIFTTEVSGGKIPGVLKTTLTGPELITGGAFGPEASVVTVIVCMTAAAIFLWLTIRRGEWRPFTLRNPARTQLS
jgi:membrane protease YdiL (CAAX protease family)